jgi:hypothetical protein
MKRRWLAVLAPLVISILAAPAAHAVPGSLYDVKATWGDTNLTPGDTKTTTAEGQFAVRARNIGDVPGTEEDLIVKDELPSGVTAVRVYWSTAATSQTGTLSSHCSGAGTGIVTCVLPAALVPQLAPAPGAHQTLGSVEPSGNLPVIYIDVSVAKNAEGEGTNTATVSGGAAAASVADVDGVPFDAVPSTFGVVPGSFEADMFTGAYPSVAPSRQAGDRPFEFRVKFDLTAETGANDGQNGDSSRYITSNGQLRTVEVTLPRGMIGNPEATPKCSPADFAEVGTTPSSTACPADTQVGYLNIAVAEGTHNHAEGEVANISGFLNRVPIYNMQPPKGVPADFAFNAGGFVQSHIYAILDPAQNYAVKFLTPNISNLLTVRGADVTGWGVPGDRAHDKFRYPAGSFGEFPAIGSPWGSAPIRPILTNPSDCGFDNGGGRIRIDSYGHPGQFTPTDEYPDPLNVTGCADPRFRFEPEVALQPTNRDAGAPTGLTVHLEVPQRSDEVNDAEELYAANGFVKAIATPPMKKVVATFPPGMTINPAAAQGLASCSPQQLGLGTDSRVECPDASQYGTLVLHTPLLPVNAQPEGFVYIAKQNDNPFHNFLSLYLVIQEPERGILIKVPGRIDLDPATGQITTTFDDLPQFPVSDMEMNLKGGLRAGLVNPQTCGTKTITATFYSWQEPTVPQEVNSNYDITRNPDGSPCLNSTADRPFNPQISGGTVNNRAGFYSPLELRMTRSDLEQELSIAEGTAPPGLLASLRGVGRCSDAAIAAAANPERTGTEEIEHPSCPASSQVGTVDAGAGVGQVLTYVKGKVYLSGPYKGAPVSGVAIVPAVAGPFDLGTIVTRAPAYVNPKTAELHLVTDKLPLIFKGVPVRVRDIQVHLDREHFILNPTNCDPFALSGTLFSSEGKSKPGGSRFQAAECASLGFRPRLSTRLFGGTHRGAHPRFRGTYVARGGDANAASAVVALPRSEFLDQSHIRTVCTRVQFAADACPAGSIYGHAEATTPLLDETLSGPVYLRSSDHKLPDLVADLHGIVDVEVAARVDSIHGGIRASFEQIPDAPVERFTISMQGGKKGLLVNSRNICAHPYALNAELGAQNGKVATLRPKMQAACAKRGRARPR